MVFTIVNSNMDSKKIDENFSELIYILESKNISLNQIALKHVHSKDACHDIYGLVENSDFVIYMTPLDSEVSQVRLKEFVTHYDLDQHPSAFIIIDSDTLLSVEHVTDHIDMMEDFLEKHNSKVIDARYFKDALQLFKDLTIKGAD